MKIGEISGIGPKTEKLFNKLDIFDINDLVTYFPYKYNVYNFGKLVSFSENLIIKAIIIPGFLKNIIAKTKAYRDLAANVPHFYCILSSSIILFFSK